MRLVTFAVAYASFTGSKVTPTQKVIQLLEDIKAKGEKEKHEEQVQFATYKTWCEHTATEKSKAIKDGNASIERLESAIAKNTADSNRLAKQIASHEDDIATWEGDKVASTRVRDIERTDFEALETHLSESIDAVTRATEVLQKENYDRKQASAKPSKEAEASLIEVMSMTSLIDTHSRRIINAFLQRDQGDTDGDAAHLAVEAPQAHGYSFQSQGVIDLLNKLKAKFEDERASARTTERNSKEAFQLLEQSLTNQVNEATRQKNEKSSTKATVLQQRGDNRGSLGDAVATRDDDSEFLSETTATCEKKAEDFEKRQQLRADEQVAVAKAIEILSSDDVTGNAKKHLPQDLSFIQLESRHKFLSAESAGPRVAAYLNEQGKRLNSRVLIALALRANDDPLRKVKKLIKDLIVKLMEEATAETEKQGWCNTELTENEHTRNAKTKKTELLYATIDQLKTSIAKITEEVQTLNEEVAFLDKSVQEATENRNKEKADNEVTVTDSKAGQDAVARALAVLQEFYSKAAKATALSQITAKARPEAPEIFDSPYKGQQGESGGVVAMLEVIQGDFARLQAETEADEVAAAKAHQQFLNESEIDKAQKVKDIEHKTGAKEDQSSLLKESEADKIGTQKELDAANAYYQTLKGQCISSGANYEDRAARREEEIESLQEALRILKSEDFE